MEFIVDHGPHIRDKDSTSKIMKRLLIALLPIIIFSIYKNGIIPYQRGYITFFETLKPLLIIIIAVFTSLLAEGLFIRLVLHKKEDHFLSYFKHSYALFPGLFLALVLPINTPLWLVSLGALVATIIGKMLFGGFGYNIFNPALIGALFVTTSYGSLISSQGGYLNAMELDTISKATPLTNLGNLGYVDTWQNIGASFGTLWDYFLGFIPGTIGETSKLLILIAMIFLIITKVIKWRIPITYLLTVSIMTFIIGVYNDMGIWYTLFHLLSGGLMFGAVFMATDPVTSPITKIGQVIFGLGLGLLTVIFRFLTPYPEGVLTAILSMNMLVFIIDKIGAKAKFDVKKAILPFSILILLILGTSLYIGYNLKSDQTVKNDKVNIIDINEIDNKIIYKVTTKGFKGLIESEIIFEDDNIKEIKILEQHESYWSEIEDNDYINKLIEGQDKIEDVDTVSGATISSFALKLMVKEVLDNYKNNR